VIVVLEDLHHLGDPVERQRSPRLDRGALGEENPPPTTFAAGCRPMPPPWTLRHRQRIIVSPCGIGWAAANSVWSAIGLVAELVIGSGEIRRIPGRRPERHRTRHFTTAALAKNLPVLMGLMAAWNRSFLHLPTLAVLPYDQRLARLPAYMQQLEMESNGQVRVAGAGERVDFATRAHRLGASRESNLAALVLSDACTQGNADGGAGFIAPLRAPGAVTEARDLGVAELPPRQSQGVRPSGYFPEEVEADLKKAGSSLPTSTGFVPTKCTKAPAEFPAPVPRDHGAFAGRPAGHCTSTACSCRGPCGGINSFDQFGVGAGQAAGAGHRHDGQDAAHRQGAAGLAALIGYVAGHR